MLAIGAAALAGVGALFAGISVSGGQSTGSAVVAGVEGDVQPMPAPVARVLSREGHRALVSAVVDRTGTSMVFGATLHPKYAVLEVPVDAGSTRQQSFHWDGHRLTALPVKGTAGTKRFDLAKYDVAVLLRLSQQARRQVAGPSSWYLILTAPDLDDIAVRAYASNEFREGGYLAATREGKIVRRVMS